MALESEPQSTPLGGSNLDALKSESCEDVDLEDGEIEDDDMVPDQVQVSPSVSVPTPRVNPPASSPPRTPQGQKNERRREVYDGSSPPPWAQRRPHNMNHKNQTTNKPKKVLKSMWGPPQKKQYEDDECGMDDDFANDIEKALKAQIKDKAQEEKDTQVYEEEEQWNRKKKKRKKHRDEDDEKDTKRHKRSRKDGGGEEEDDEMIFVRGASPVQHEMHDSPPYGGPNYDDIYDSYEDDGEEDEYETSPDRGGHGSYMGRGRGRGVKMGRGRGGHGSRGRGAGPNDSGRGGFSSRGKKRGGQRGGPVGKPQRLSRSQSDRPQDGICTFYMQGKCSKGPDECPYSHDAMPPRKMELCKFYLMNCCAKRDKCLYMHHDFPCKFYHTGLKCDAGERNCRFSHGKLTDITHNILIKHLETAPKEILGEFPRLTRDSANNMIHDAKKARAQGLNPEDMERRFDEEGGYESDCDRAPTPMPSSPIDPVPSEMELRRGRSDESESISRKRDHHSREREMESEHDRENDCGRDRERKRTRDRDRDRHHEHGDKREHRERKRKKRWDTPDASPTRLQKLQEKIQKELREQEEKASEKGKFRDQQDLWEDERCPVNEQQSLRLREDDKQSLSWPPGRPMKHEAKTFPKERGHYEETNNQAVSGLFPKKETDQESEKEKMEDVGLTSDEKPLTSEDAGDSGGDSQDSSGTIPSHLPKRQRELFLRIQQQQREAEHNQNKKTEDSDDEPPPEDDWYSSDEDGATSLSDMLKNLPKKEQEKSKKDAEKFKSDHEKESHLETPKSEQHQQPPRRPPLLPTPVVLSDLMKNSAIDKLLSSFRYGSQSSTQPPSQHQPVSTPAQSEDSRLPQELQSPHNTPAPSVPPPMRDPRLTRDPRSRNVATAAATSPSASPAHSAEVRSDPRIERNDPRSDPRDIRDRDHMSSDSHKADHRSDPPRFDRIDPRLERTDPRVDRADPRLDRTDLRSDPRVEPRPRVDPRLDSRAEPRSERRDPRKESRSESRHDPRTSPTDVLTSPRGDSRNDARPADPRAARMEVRRSSAGSGSSTSSNSNPVIQRSIYDGAILPALSGAGDVDLRLKNAVTDPSGDTDFRTQLGAGDMDMRRLDMSSLLGTSRFSAQDTDLRVGKGNTAVDLEGEYTSSHNDLDLRRIQMSLPFKPAPVHTPATEINASLSSYTPRPYRVSLVEIPRPDFSTLKINIRDPQARLDPRLRRIFRLSQDEPLVDNATQESEATPAGSQLAAPTPSDPRIRNSTNSTRPADPRHGRISTPSMGFCPPTPRVDDYDEPTSNGSDTDLRVQGFYGQAPWDGGNRGRGLLPTPEPSAWMPPGRQVRHSYQHQRSYTPPPS